MSSSNGNGQDRPRQRAVSKAAVARYVAFEKKAEDMARRFAFKAHRLDELEDLIQEAKLGLWKAAKSYRKNRGTQFWSWAHWSVKGAIEHWLRDRAWVVRPSRKVTPSERWLTHPMALDIDGRLPNSVPYMGSDGPTDVVHRDIGEVTDGGLGRVELLVAMRGHFNILTRPQRRLVTLLFAQVNSQSGKVDWKAICNRMRKTPEQVEAMRAAIAEQLEGVL